jgi:hypothetical protein
MKTYISLMQAETESGSLFSLVGKCYTPNIWPTYSPYLYVFLNTHTAPLLPIFLSFPRISPHSICSPTSYPSSTRPVVISCGVRILKSWCSEPWCSRRGATVSNSPRSSHCHVLQNTTWSSAPVDSRSPATHLDLGRCLLGCLCSGNSGRTCSWLLKLPVILSELWDAQDKFKTFFLLIFGCFYFSR